MAHFSIEYSANLEPLIDMADLCDTIRRAAIDTGVFPVAGIRVRAICATHVSIADGDPKHGFLDLSVRLRGGRDLPTRTKATERIFQSLQTIMAPILAVHPIGLSMEMRDIDPALSPKINTIRDHLENHLEKGL